MSFRFLDCLLYIFLYINYRQITRSSQETSPAKVLWANSGLHQLLPRRTIDVLLMVLEMVLLANSKCSLTDLTKRSGAALKKKKRLKESNVHWVGTGLFIANYPLTTPALSSQSSVAFLFKLGS